MRVSIKPRSELWFGCHPGGSSPVCTVINMNLFIEDGNRPFRCLPKLWYMLPVQQSDIVVIIWYLDRCWDFTEPSTTFSSCWHCSLFSWDAPATVHNVIMTPPLSVSLRLSSLQTGAWTTADMDAEHQTLPSHFLKVICDEMSQKYPVIVMLGLLQISTHDHNWINPTRV